MHPPGCDRQTEKCEWITAALIEAGAWPWNDTHLAAGDRFEDAFITALVLWRELLEDRTEVTARSARPPTQTAAPSQRSLPWKANDHVSYR